MSTKPNKDSTSLSKGEEDYAKALIESYIGGLADAVRFLDNYTKTIDKNKMFDEYMSLSKNAKEPNTDKENDEQTVLGKD